MATTGKTRRAGELNRWRLRRSRRVNRSRAANFFIFTIMALFGVFMAFPMVYAISNSLKPLDELWEFPPKFFVRNPTLKNFRDLFTLMGDSWVPMSRYLFNTVFITVAGTVGHVILSSMCAYPLAKMQFRGRGFLFNLVVLSLMFNGTVLSIPSYIVMAQIGWLDTYRAIIVPALGSSLGLYLMKQFMENIPDTLLEAATIDGANEWVKFIQIVMPQVKPAWLTLTIFSVQNLWNISGSVYIYREELKTLPYALNQVVSGGIARAGAASAVVVVMMIVPVVVFIISQSNVIETMTSSGIKG